MNRKKTSRPDGIATEMLSALDDFDIEVMNEIYNSDHIPEDLPKSIFITFT